MICTVFGCQNFIQSGQKLKSLAAALNPENSLTKTSVIRVSWSCSPCARSRAATRHGRAALGLAGLGSSALRVSDVSHSRSRTMACLPRATRHPYGVLAAFSTKPTEPTAFGLTVRQCTTQASMPVADLSLVQLNQSQNFILRPKGPWAQRPVN